MLDEESKCSVFKRVEGAGAPRDESMVSMERYERRLEEGDAAGLNTSLPLGALPRARGDSFVAGAYSGSPQLYDGFGNLFLRKSPQGFSCSSGMRLAEYRRFGEPD
jgi:hypothetical protein